MKKLIFVLILITLLVSCAPEGEYISNSSTTKTQDSRVESELVNNYVLKLYDRDTGALCYANIRGGIVCKFLEK